MPPVVIPLLRSPPAKFVKKSGKTTSNSMAMPVQIASPAISPDRGLFRIPATTSRMPTTKSVHRVTMITAATTASGMPTITATSLGKQARAIRASPANKPTLRDATPVVSIVAIGVGWSVLGSPPARLARMLPPPSAATAPCTERKSTARGGSPGYTLGCDGYPYRLGGPDKRYENEARQQRPESWAETKVQPRGTAFGQSDPRRLGHASELGDPHQRGHRGPGCEPDHRGPQAKSG